ncbi:MAG: hypothetical protein J1F28_04260, partial [Oscillospiraceae bacterium]|nr:hypothetical protein [Oscillospiraceae bacterium]
MSRQRIANNHKGQQKVFEGFQMELFTKSSVLRPFMVAPKARNCASLAHRIKSLRLFIHGCGENK